MEHKTPVQLMITITDEPGGTQVRVDGWLEGDGVAEFVRVVDAAAGPVRLLLRDLRGADAAGLAALRRLTDRGTSLEGLSPYIRLMLANSASAGPFGSHPLARSETPVRREDL